MSIFQQTPEEKVETERKFQELREELKAQREAGGGRPLVSVYANRFVNSNFGMGM